MLTATPPRYPHGVFPLSSVIGNTLMQTMFPNFRIFALAASSVFNIPFWRHFIAWIGAKVGGRCWLLQPARQFTSMHTPCCLRGLPAQLDVAMPWPPPSLSCPTLPSPPPPTPASCLLMPCTLPPSSLCAGLTCPPHTLASKCPAPPPAACPHQPLHPLLPLLCAALLCLCSASLPSFPPGPPSHPCPASPPQRPTSRSSSRKARWLST